MRRKLIVLSAVCTIALAFILYTSRLLKNELSEQIYQCHEV